MNYRTQLENLRERFLRVDSKGKFQSACVKGGLIVKQYFSDGGIIGNPELTKFLSDYLNAADDTHDSLLAEFTLWSGFLFLANWASDDPNILEYKVFSRADGITLLNSKPGSHEEKSERFAAFCQELIDMLESQPPKSRQPDKPITQWLVKNDKRYEFRTDAEAVRAYMKDKKTPQDEWEAKFYQLYQIDFKNDKKANPLLKRKAKS